MPTVEVAGKPSLSHCGKTCREVFKIRRVYRREETRPDRTVEADLTKLAVNGYVRFSYMQKNNGAHRRAGQVPVTKIHNFRQCIGCTDRVVKDQLAE